MHLARKLFYRLIRGIADHDIVLDMAEFFLVDKRVRDAVLSTRSTFPFVRGQVGYVGFRREGIRYKRERRLVGETHYNVLRAIQFGVGGILSSSTFPLRVLAYAGSVVVALDLAAAAGILVWGGRLGLGPAGRVLAALVVFHLGWMVFGLGSLGIYLARVYKDTMGLPLYIVDDKQSSYQRRSDP